ncbi:MAG: hypothetical protein PHQ40_00520 [Anaerolineaceae bacterium]|nr:hypothetical protein [Anaerolineaceae bacterium]MDD5367540.1 hypothetical protein [Anaerolineaceae bacterium]
MTTDTIVAIVALLLISITSGFCGYIAARVRGTLRAYGERIAELEAVAKRQRHTENTIAGVEDAGLISVAEIYRLQATIDHNNLILDHTRNQLIKQSGILSVVRQGPRAYPVDPPSGNAPGEIH